MIVNNKLIYGRLLLFGLLLFTGLISGTANAAVTNLQPGWPRFIIKNMALQNSGTAGAGALAAANGISLLSTGTSLFVANSTDKIQWLDQSGGTKTKLLGPSASMWAEVDTVTNTVLQGRIDIFGDLLGFNGLQFGADLSSSLNAKPDKIGFGQINHSGNVCNLGFCTNVEELLLFKDLNNFNGNFATAFAKNSKVISTVPLLAAAWLFITGFFGLLGFRQKRLNQF